MRTHTKLGIIGALVVGSLGGSFWPTIEAQQPVTVAGGTITANAGTDLSTASLALESGGNIAATVTELQALSHAEDAAHSSGQLGMMSLCVRQSAQADFGADGDYTPCSIDDDGNVRVAFAGSIGAVPEDDDDGDIAAGQSVAVSAMLLYSWDGDSWIRAAVGLDWTASSAIGSTAPGQMFEAKDFDGAALPQTASAAEGDAIPAAGSLYGIGYGAIVNEDGSLMLALPVEDLAETASAAGFYPMSVRRDAAAASAGSPGDNATFNTDALGLLWTRQLDPCSGVAKSYISIDITTATTTEITSALAGASTHYYICSINLVTDAANDVALVDDDTDDCASVTSGLAGGLTAGEGWNFVANGGLALGNGNGAIMRTAGTNRVLCLVTSAATQLAGHMVVAAAP